MSAPASSLYIALAALTLIVLSARVILLRRRHGVAVGDAGHHDLARAIRVHGNFIEYTPLALLVLLAAERAIDEGWIVHTLGIALLAGRLAHAYGLNHEPDSYAGRVSGMALTLTVLGFGAMLVLLSFFGRLRGAL